MATQISSRTDDKISNGVKFAVIETGGKQYLVKPGDKIQVEKLAGDKGADVSFDKVLLLGEENKVALGAPFLAGNKVEGKILKQARADKVLVMKYHNKTRYRRKRGHRQFYTEVQIVSI